MVSRDKFRTESRSRYRTLMRRQFLIASGALSTTVVAGCLGDDSDVDDIDDVDDVDDVDDADDTDDVTDVDDVDDVDDDVHELEEEHQTWYMAGPDDWAEESFQWYVDWGNRIWHHDLPSYGAMDEPLVYEASTATFRESMAADAEIDGSQLHLELKDHYWHDGTQYTTEDFAAGWDLLIMDQKHREVWEGDVVEEVEILDDQSMTLHLHRDDFNPTFAKRRALLDNMSVGGHSPCGVRKEVYRPWIESLGDIGPGSEEFDEEWIELLEWDPYRDDDWELADLGHGPFEIVEISDTDMRLEKFEDHHNADNIGIQTIISSPHEEVGLAFTQRQIDYHFHGFPWEDDIMGDLEANIGEDNYEIIHHNNFNVVSTAFNCGQAPDGTPLPGNRPVYDRHIRRAIAFVTDYEASIAPMGAGHLINDAPDARLYPAVTEAHGGDIPLDDFTAYGPESQPERAIEEIEQSDNYFYENDQVVDENGEQVELEVITSEGAGQRRMLVEAEQWSQFGFAPDVSVLDGAAAWDRYFEAEFDIMPAGGGAQAPEDRHNAASWEWVQLYTHFANEHEIPMPPGDEDGDLQTVNIIDQFMEYNTAPDRESYIEAMRVNGWWWNWFMPHFEPLVRQNFGIVRSDRWNWSPREPEDEMEGAEQWHWRIMLTGEIWPEGVDL